MEDVFAIIVGLALLTFCAPESLATGKWSFDLESGAAVPGYNDVRIPGDSGTKFSLTEELEADPVAFVRARLTFSFSDRNHLSLLAAPFRFHSKGVLTRDIRFGEARFLNDVFHEGTAVETRYRFDSYRLTYRRDFISNEKLRLGFGLTGKIRDASISVEGGGRKETSSNTGFVPLINFSLAWAIAPRFSFDFSGDALAAPQGRAEDVFGGLNYTFSDNIGLKAGYRILEGGADNDKVYTFALIHYAAVGLILSF